ncbi:FAD-binding oxidoreductase [Herbiconiux solani]|uniref:FAD-binding oxidoreductase n=1 Tax=Herbiconiux solani TaxID=661329 RepID=UPI0008250914|nr:FAD-binding oxidoreductase [Herbiconiux solani]
MTFTTDELDALDLAVEGPVLRRGDSGLAAEAAGQNTTVVRDPDVLVGALTEADVQAAVRFAAAHGLAVHVLATGHGVFAPVTGGMLVTTRRLDALEIDAEARVARIGAGNRWGAVIEAAAVHGLAPVTGASGHVGAIGYTLGGGLGPLARSHGYSSDYARTFRLVTATGEAITVHAGEDGHPELFWALRGGKGGFGVVTSMDFELVPLTTFYGGSLFFDAEHIPAVLRAWARFTDTAPEEATSSVSLLRFPPLPVVPEALRGKTVVSLRYVHVGEPEEAERVFAPLRAVAPAVFGRVGEMPAAQIGLVHNDPVDPGPAWDRGMLLDLIDDDLIEAFLDVLGPEREVPIVAAELRHLGGATLRDVPGGSAVGGRPAAGTLVLIGVPDPALFDGVLPAVADGITARLAPWVSASNTINFAGDLSVPGSFESCWAPEVLERLARVRAEWDPAGMFPYPVVGRVSAGAGSR